MAKYKYVGTPVLTRGEYGVNVTGGHTRPDDRDSIYVYDPDFGDLRWCSVSEAETNGFRPVGSAQSTSFRLSTATRAQLRDLATEYGTQAAVVTVAVDRMWRETMGKHTSVRVTAAQMIRRYQGPQWIVEPVGEPSEPDDIANINASHPYVLQNGVRGWGDYDAIVRVPLACAGDVDYLASLDPAPRRD